MLHHSISSDTLKQKTYNLHGNLKLSMNISKNQFDFAPDALFEMGVRINKKRQFLFISKVLGKHLLVDPAISLGTGSIMASMLMESEGESKHPELTSIVEMVNSGIPNRILSETSLAYKSKLPTKTVFIGFAETATGLGHSVFNHFKEANYLHTTREEMTDISPSFYFEEEHSHATSHLVYAAEAVLKDAETIVLIDDEMTTGLTISNLIIAMNKSFPGKRYKILTILDWRSDQHQRDFIELMDHHAISAEVIAILSGQFSLLNQTVIEENEIVCLNGNKAFDVLEYEEVAKDTLSKHKSKHAIYSTFTGRFGLTSEHHLEMDAWIQKLASKLSHIDRDKSTLVIGIGENIYIPHRLALLLGEHTKVQTTTRSPVFADNKESYPIKHKSKFILPDSNGIDQYLYNLPNAAADQIVVIAESVSDKATWLPLLTYLESLAPVTWLSLTVPCMRGEVDEA